MQTMLPFASTLIRAIVGFAGFFVLLAIQKGLGRLRDGIKDAKGLKYATLLTLFGPVFGVSLSLMAVQYANAGIASTLMALTPVMIILPDVLINKKKITIKEVIGVAVTMVGVALFFLYQ
ncbi:MAG: DMT family transporter [Bacteroidales bacterium]|nr:DMT family transporter [Bacteroidales bacterium]